MSYSPLPYHSQDKSKKKPEIFARPERLGPPEIEAGEIHYNESTDYLGEGVFGKVFKGRCRQTSVAVKVPKAQHLSPQQIEDFRREVAIMSQIFHPNIVLFMGACTQPGNIKIVTEMMSADLEALLHSPKAREFPAYKRIKLAKDAAKGMSWLHGINNIIHRDLKPANLLIDNTYSHIKVTDFGFSEILKGDKTMRDIAGPRGTALWMAPEVMNNEEFDKSSDVYGFGIILWQLYTLNEPFEDFDDWDEFYEAICIDNLRPEIPPECPASLQHLMEACWDPDRKYRPSFPEVVYRLDEGLIDLAITNTNGAKFWKKYFLLPKQELEEIVRWRDFVAALYDATKIADRSKFDFLHPFIAIDSELRVTMQSFDSVIPWFGEFFVEEKADATLKDAKKLLSEQWFHGFIDQVEADGRLRADAEQLPVGKTSGAFLVRLSKTQKDSPYTLSLCGQRHLRIKKVIGSNGEPILSVGSFEQTFKSLFELISCLTPILKLTHPCPKIPARNAYSNNI